MAGGRATGPERLGIAWAQLVGINPRLVYCSLTGYGVAGGVASALF